MQLVGQGLPVYRDMQSGVLSCPEPLCATGPEIMNNANERGSSLGFITIKRFKRVFFIYIGVLSKPVWK